MITIAIDFDGTIVDHQYPDIGDDNPHAIEWIKKFMDLDTHVILYTMRSGIKLSEAKEYLSLKGVSEMYGYNFNPGQSFWTSSPKVFANIYIDDAAFGCPMIKIDGFERECVDWTIVGPAVYKIIKDKEL